MSRPQDDDLRGRSPAGPDPDDRGTTRAAGAASTPSAGASDEVPRRDDQGDGPSDPSKVEKDLDDLLADTQRERDEYLDLAKRTKADFENYRKRMAADVQAANARGKAELARDLIDAVDNLERALEVAGVDPEQEDGNSSVEDGEGLVHGVVLVFRGLRETLLRNGIEAIDPKGDKFDPTVHEALSTLPGLDVEAGTVVEVMQKGYRLGEQLIRPARVVVAG